MELTEHLAEYVRGIAETWMNIIDLPGAPGDAKVHWQENGTFELEGCGRFRLTVSVEEIEEPKDEFEWTASTWEKCLLGDKVRVPGTDQTAVVEKIYVGEWHVKDEGWNRVSRYERVKSVVKLAGRDSALDFPLGSPIEIHTDATRRAALVLSEAFPGTTKIGD